MKPFSMRRVRPLSALIAIACLVAEVRSTAQTFTSLYSFTARVLIHDPNANGPAWTNSDGAWPNAGVVLSGNTLYGTARSGGSLGNGTIFSVNTDGTGFEALYNFPGYDPGIPENDLTGSLAELVLSGDTLYGTTYQGGDSFAGTVFAINTNGTGFSTLYSFSAATWPGYTNSDGTYPEAELVLSGGILYGTAHSGGVLGSGTVFAVNTDGTGFATLHAFTATSCCPSTNRDGAGPMSGLVLSGNTLYGTALQGGIHSSGYGGTVFAVNTNGTSFTNLHSFAGYPTDGDNPTDALILSGNTLYGTTSSGGTGQCGTVFKVNTDGRGFTTLHNFALASSSSPYTYTNGDGCGPSAGLILSGETLYGTAAGGGDWGSGTVFKVNTDGTGFTTLYRFTALNTNSSGVYTNRDGSGPSARLILSGKTLYGTATEGGDWGSGTVFSLSLPPPQLTIIHAGANVILTWPTNATGFTLQSTTNLGSASAWAPVSPPPVLVNGQYTVTNPVSGTRQFYRLSQ